jgi:hypothetical protein
MTRRLRNAFVWLYCLTGLALAVVGIWGYATDRVRVQVISIGLMVLIFAIAGVTHNIADWRGESYSSRQIIPPEWWPYSPGLWRANVRATTVLAVGAVPAMVASLLTISVWELDWPAPAGQLWWAMPVALLAVALWVTVVGLALSVALVNRPSFVVPPHLRSQPGMLDGDNHSVEEGAEEHRTPRELGLEGDYPRDPDR